MLEDRCKESENTITALGQDKTKLETFTQRTLSHFRDKFIDSLDVVRNEKAELESKLKEIIDKYQQNKLTTQKEEKLIMSAMYEIGLRTMDANISAQLGKTIKTPSNVATPKVNFNSNAYMCYVYAINDAFSWYHYINM